MFLGITPTVSSWSPDGKECSLLIDDNPLTMFVELPESHGSISYSNIICGVLRGALQMVSTLSPISLASRSFIAHERCKPRLKLSLSVMHFGEMIRLKFEFASLRFSRTKLLKMMNERVELRL